MPLAQQSPVRRWARRSAVAAVAAAVFFGLPATASAQRTITAEIPPKPPGSSAFVSAAVGPGDFSLTFVEGDETGETPTEIIRGECPPEQAPCMISDTPSADDGAVPVRFALFGTDPTFLEVSEVSVDTGHYAPSGSQ